MQLPLLIPIENQVRELDPKLLLATYAANAGIPSYIGYRTEMDITISKLPRGLYLAKSFTQRSNKMFRILSKLGHIICAWDEEALVHYSADIYFKRRLSPIALSYVSHLFAWGQDNEDLFKAYPHLPKNIPIHKVGNPRLDLLRKEFSYYFDEEINRIKQQHGNFILINTNFGDVNAHLPIHNLFINKDENGNYKEMGRGAKGMGREFSEGRAKYKQYIFDEFKKMIPHLAEKFPCSKFIIRPHPVENEQVYRNIASKFNNVEVSREGSVIPWIRAATTLIHSGCTTGIEAYLSSKPCIAYMPIVHDRYGGGAEFPNGLSNQAHSMIELEKLVEQHQMKGLPLPSTEMLSKFIEYNESILCCDKMVLIFKEIIQDNMNHPHLSRL